MSNPEESVRQKLEEWAGAGESVNEEKALRLLRLVRFLNARCCSGLQEKLTKELFPSRPKLESILAEFEMAEVITLMGGQATLLCGENPDLEVRGLGGQCFIEVVRKSADTGHELLYGTELQNVLGRFPLKVRPQIPASLAVPVCSYPERAAREKRMVRLVDWLSKEIPRVAHGELPCVLVEPPLPNAPASLLPQQQRTLEDRSNLILYWLKAAGFSVKKDSIRNALLKNVDGVIFMVESCPGQDGYMTGGLTDAFWIPDEEIKQQLFLRAIGEKSKKHKNVRKAQVDACYVIGLRVEESLVSPIYLLSLLYGPLVYSAFHERSWRKIAPEHMARFKDAESRGWGALLRMAEFELTQEFSEGEQGIFLREEFEDVDGVFVLYGNCVQLVPNLFTGKKRSLRLLDWLHFPEALQGIPLDALREKKT